MLTVVGCVTDKRESKAALSVMLCDASRKRDKTQTKNRMRAQRESRGLFALVAFKRSSLIVAYLIPFILRT